MPANRSRTFQWRRCLQQICDRGGSIEVAIARSNHEHADDLKRCDLIWRVRVLALSDTDIVIEQPEALGRAIPFQDGIELIAVMSVGQNRWTFNTEVIGTTQLKGNGHQTSTATRLRMPDAVQRCQRRNYYRVSTASLNLPAVDIWPLVDPASVVIAERANELMVDDPRLMGLKDIMDALTNEDEPIMPDVGPKFTATLLNVGGGGIGLLVEPDDSQMLNRHKLYWLRISLPPHLDAPVCATGKLVHTHLESSHHVYAGLAFDFSFNPCHQRFVIDQICRYIAMQQKEQLLQQDQAAPHQRRSA